MKLRRLTGLERGKIEDELKDLLEKIEYYNRVLSSEEMVLGIVKDELTEIRDKYGDDRRTTIDMTAIDYIEDESLIPEENIIVTLTNKGYIKRLSANSYKSQHRGGVGVKGMSTNEEDYVEHMINLSTHDYLLFFTNKGKVYRMKGYEIPEYSRQAKGLPIINLLQIEKDESINSLIKMGNDDDYKFLVFGTKKGFIKKTLISEFENIRNSGKICISLRNNDELIGVKKSTGNEYIMMGSSEGRMAVFNENEIRVMGRTASGVRGINLVDADCVGIEVVSLDNNILIATKKGYGKKTLVSEFRTTKRGSKGVKALNITEKNGSLVSFKIIDDNQDLMIITNSGIFKSN